MSLAPFATLGCSMNSASAATNTVTCRIRSQPIEAVPEVVPERRQRLKGRARGRLLPHLDRDLLPEPARMEQLTVDHGAPDRRRTRSGPACVTGT